MAELGETTNPKDLIPGEPGAITNDLRGLLGNIKGLHGIGGDLGRIDPVQWVGEASSAFRDKFSAEPPKWLNAAELIGESGKYLADYGDVLTWAQGQAQRAIEMYTQAQAASRAAAAKYDVQAQAAQAAGQMIAPFADPAQGAMQNAQGILSQARQALEQAGGAVAYAFGLEPDGEGKYSKTLGEREFGADNRQKQRRWDPATGQWVEEDPGGWQRNRFGKSYSKEFGNQADGLLGSGIGDLLKGLGIDVPEKTWKASADVALLEGSIEGKFDSGLVSGSGKLEGGVLGAGASAEATASWLGVSGKAEAEAYLAKGSAEGELKFGDHAGVSGKGEAFVGAKAEAEGNIGWTGAEGSASAFAGARAEGEASAEVAGVGAGVTGEAWAGAGAEASGQFGMGNDGKFHVGGSVGVALGVGGKVGFDVSVDPGEVVSTVTDTAKEVGNVASDVGHGIASGAKSVGHFLGF
ncbi:putative T7SS-secreted protein [Amycolatopsis taiwanensis]|uniref:putative T7SS-secreted protein n=1 Tax=Amycolatopsis taiwanensis TaxID=342230 RepID=UPI0004AD551D|nr:hypothetical protein [Amycolatopsis taiwanensis]